MGTPARRPCLVFVFARRPWVAEAAEAGGAAGVVEAAGVAAEAGAEAAGVVEAAGVAAEAAGVAEAEAAGVAEAAAAVAGVVPRPIHRLRRQLGTVRLPRFNPAMWFTASITMPFGRWSCCGSEVSL
jgi:hypothetical protein